MQGFERKTRHRQKQCPVSLLGSGEVCLFSPCLGRLRRKPQFLSCFQGLETHIHTAFACSFVFSRAHEFHGFNFLPFPWVEYPSCSILLCPVVREGYLCSTVEHIRAEAQKDGQSVDSCVQRRWRYIYIYICVDKIYNMLQEQVLQCISVAAAQCHAEVTEEPAP